MRYVSPLRYPGGKAQLVPFFEDLVEREGLQDATYVEPYAGGAAVGLTLLLREHLDAVHINDASRAVYAFWICVLEHTNELLKRLGEVDVTLEEWELQRAIIDDEQNADLIDLGFAAFFLNRTNRSGMIHSGGVIGGTAQTGAYKIDARFNREALAHRIKVIASYRSRIHVYNEDALVLLRRLVPTLPAKSIIYLDPPYYGRARRLYPRWYRPDDHAAVASTVRRLRRPWVVTYDDCPEIRALYSGCRHVAYDLRYSAHASYRSGGEIAFMSAGLEPEPTALPGAWEDGGRAREDQES